MWNNHFNISVLTWLWQFTSMSAAVNQVVHFISGSNLFKGLPLMSVLWYFWYRDADLKSTTRPVIIGTLIGCVVAVLIARATNDYGPFQPRPFANALLGYPGHIGLPAPDSQALYLWSSFPSDHAALFFAIATGICLISRITGFLLYLYVLIFIGLPRIYLGLHYPTDILAGALLGIICVAAGTRVSATQLFGRYFRLLLERYPAAFQAGLFIVTVEIGTLFGDVRMLLAGIMKYLPL